MHAFHRSTALVKAPNAHIPMASCSTISPLLGLASAERDLARDLITLQNEKLAEMCAKVPDRLVGLATSALQHPELAAEQLEYGIKKLGMRGGSIGSQVGGEELANPRFDIDALVFTPEGVRHLVAEHGVSQVPPGPHRQ